jgi:hypothetical protein
MPLTLGVGPTLGSVRDVLGLNHTRASAMDPLAFATGVIILTALMVYAARPVRRRE